MKQQLIEKFAPHNDEGVVAYLRRLALHNGYANWRQLVRAIDIHTTYNALWKSGNHLQRSLGLDPTWVKAVLPRGQEGTGLYAPFFRRQTADPICPACLANSEHIRLAWSHCLVTACPEHGTTLVDICPDCEKQLRSDRASIIHCDCGFDLRHAAAPPATLAQCWLSARLAGDMRPFDGIAELGSPDDYPRLANLIFGLVVRFDPSVKVRPSKVIRPRSAGESLAFLAPVFEVLEDWPNRFADHVRRRFEESQTRRSSLVGCLGPWYTNLYSICRKPPAFAPLWTVFSDTALESFEGVLRFKNILTPTPGKRRAYLSLDEAAKHIGVSSPALRVAIEKGHVKATISCEGNNYRVIMVSMQEVEQVKCLRASWTTESTAAKQIGVSESVMIKLVRSRVLESDPNWRQTLDKSGPLSVAVVNSLIPRLTAFVEPRSEEDTLTFNQLTARRSTDIKALHSLYVAIFRGDVRPIRHDIGNGLGGFVFSNADIRAYLGSVALSTSLTLVQLERATGWKYQTLSHWCELGILEFETVTLRGSQARLVTVGAIAKFRGEWIPLSEVAKSLGSKSSAVAARLGEKGVRISGLSESTAGVRRGGLIRIRDLAKLAGLGPS
jgi:DNA-binding XRE family transcriptional regulator